MALNQVKTVSPNYTCAYSELTGQLAIHNSNPGSFTLATTDELLDLGVWDNQHFGLNPQDANDVLGVANNKFCETGTLYLNNMIRTMLFQNIFI